MPATLRCFRPRPVSIVTCAVVIANRRSLVGTFSLRRPPRSASRKPTLGGARERALELGLVALEPLDPLLGRRVVHEQRAHGGLGGRWDGGESAELARGGRVLLGGALSVVFP